MEIGFHPSCDAAVTDDDFSSADSLVVHKPTFGPQAFHCSTFRLRFRKVLKSGSSPGRYRIADQHTFNATVVFIDTFVTQAMKIVTPWVIRRDDWPTGRIGFLVLRHTAQNEKHPSIAANFAQTATGRLLAGTKNGPRRDNVI
jgi:hypothetical protein